MNLPLPLPAAPELLDIARRLAVLPPEKRALFRQRLRERGIDAAQLPILPLQPRPASLPLSYAQQRLWFLQQLEPESAAYNLPGAVLLSGALNVDALRQALQALLRRHEVLRTGFVEREGRAEQCIAYQVDVDLPAVDLRALDPAAREAELQRRLTQEADRPFDLARPPLLRLCLLRLGEHEQVLLLTLHHLVADGLSLGLLIRELGTHYAAACAGRAAALPPLPIQYADYALWQQDWLGDEALAPQLDYWCRQLGGEQPGLELPSDHPRPARASGRGERLRFAIDADLTAGLRRLARAQGITPYMLLQAVFALLLHKLSGQRALRVGVPVAGRGRLETEPLIGCFVNTQVLHLQLGGALRFEALLRQVKDSTLGAQAHADLPFERLVEALQPERDLSRSPLFQAMFSLQPPAADSAGFADLTLEVLPLQRGTTQFDLSLDLIERGDTLEGLFTYSTDLFEPASIARFAGYYRQLLEAVLARPEAALAQLDLLGAEETRQLMQEWNRGEACASVPLVHERFVVQAAATPETIALIFDDQQLSYAELDARANRLAQRLLAAGLGPETRVGLLVERSVELVVALLAVLKAGGTYVPLDPAYPAERLAYMLDDAGIELLLAQAEVSARINLQGRRVLDVADVDGSVQPPTVRVRPQQLAYLMYTSGSTGKPKGVGIDHAALAAHAEVARQFFGLKAGERMLQFATFNFDGFVEQLYPALCCGATVVLRGPELWDSEELYQRLHRHGVTVMDLTTAYWFQVVQDWAGLGPRDYGPLRQVNVGGEAMPPEGIGAWQKAGLQALRLLNTYGPTEATVTATIYDCAEEVAGTRAIATQMPIGQALGGRALYILDADANPVPVGVIGELCIGGPLLARSYHNRPDLTAERFLPDPFGESGARLYRTGDLARWRRDGLIEYVGRVDHQVKIRGFRIELSEIEARLLTHPALREALVLVRDERLVAYVVAREAVSVEALRAHLKDSLPDYMLPSAYVLLPALPLTPNGKLDRRALPAPDYAAEETYAAPRTATEATLAQLWAELLGVERVGIHDSFFALGGHSLLATRLVSRLRRELNCELPIRALFEAPTIAQLAERLPAASTETAPIPVVSRDRPLPLSFAQQRLWFLQQLEPKSSAYNMPGALRLVGALDVAALQAAFHALIQRHESLRTSFQSHGDEALQCIADSVELPLHQQDLSTLDQATRAAELQHLADLEAQRPFDLSTAPLMRVSVLRLAAQEHVLLVTLHHIIADGWSLAVLTRELAAAYASYARGTEPRWSPLPLQYADYAVWQREQLSADTLRAQLNYWTAELGGEQPLLELPTDRPRPRIASGRGATLRRALDPALAARLQALAQGQGATLFMTVLAAFDLLLYKLSGQRDLRVGVPVANRPRVETENLIGFFVNTQVLRAQLDSLQPFSALLQQVKEKALAAQGHADLPFERLVEALQPERELSRTPLFQVMFNWVPAEASAPPALAGLKLEPLAQQRGTTQFELSLDVIERGQGLELLWTYSLDLFEAGSIERHAGYFEALLDAVSREPQVPLARLSMLGPGELQALTPPATYPQVALVHERIAAQAAARPQATALMLDDRSLSYAELDARATALAQRLLAAGLVPEMRVGICLERSLELVVALLAVLKAGGAYVPLDPAYPQERLRYIARDAGLRLLIVEPALDARFTCEALQCLRVDGEPATEASLPAVQPKQLAYLIYTSGSTGQPKGVGVSHAALAAHAEIARGYLGLGAEDRVLQFASVSFDAFVEQCFPTLLSGAALVLRGPQLWDSATLHTQIRDHGITVADLPTAYWAQVLQDWAQQGLRAPSSWRLATVGGEAMPPSALQDWIAAGLNGVRLLNAYGPTEATVTATIYDCAEEVAGTRPIPTQMPIGQALGGRALYILDADANPVPLGVTGELCIGGPLLARGYHNRPDLTAERFLPDPFDEPGARLYRTGDLARWRSDGLIEYVGRVDHQVKIRGFRIELAEIEARLLAHPALREALVLVREERLVAYIVARETVSVETLRAHLKDSLPDYMLPAAYVLLPALPLTPNGKLDRRALPAPDYAAEETYTAPRNATEATLARLWAELLSIERVGIHDNFFALGGHSLLATRLVSRLRRELNCELPIRALFEAPTVAQLAGRLPAASAETAPIPVTPRDRPLPLSFAQQRLWFLQQLEPESSAYNMPGALRLVGALDLAALQAAVDALVARHEVLRSVCREEEGEARQCILPPAPVSLPLIDLTALDADSREARLRTLAEAEAWRPFALRDEPPLRLQLLRLGENEYVLLATLHHIAADAGSLELMIRELGEHYAAARVGREAALSPLPIQYADYAVWQRQHLDDGPLQTQLDYWTRQLGREQPLLELPLDRPRPRQASGAGAVHRFVIEPALRARLEALGRKQGSTLFMSLFALFALLLQRLSGQRDLHLGVPITHRPRWETENLIGFFVNTQVLRVQLDGALSFDALLQQVKETALAAQAHADLPFERLVEVLQPERDLSRTPLFQVMFNLLQAEKAAPASQWPGLSLEPWRREDCSAAFDLSLDLIERGDTLEGLFTYSTDLFEAETIARFAGYYRQLLEAVLARPEEALAQLSMLGADETRQFTQDWNRGEDCPSLSLVHERFATQAAATPDAVALILDDQQLSYVELDARANRLAQRLLAAGLGPETRVGLLVERSVELVVALLAVFKAGGTYVPLDPAYPTERLAYMLEDAGIELLLGQAEVCARTDLKASRVLDVADVDSPAHAPSVRVLPQQLAYLMYTSGSTGKPKGVGIDHAALAAHAEVARQFFGLKAGERMLQFATFNFDGFVEQLYPALCCGATVVLRGPEIWDSEGLYQRLHRHGITVMDLTTAYWFQVVQDWAALGARDYGPLRQVNVGGEAMPPEGIGAWQRAGLQALRLLNTYGPTEATVTATIYDCAGEVAGIRAVPTQMPIGQALGGRALYILDADANPVPVGVIGELCIGGPLLARGYHNRSDLTAERFLPDPFGEPGARLYRTGDLARWRTDGLIEYVGRVDHQVKIRGFRIELSEIEARLLAHPALREALVLVRDERLVAYIVARETVSVETLRAHLKDSLPDYMLPAAYVLLPALPLTPNGKLDRRALPAPDYAAEETYTAPRNATEATLAQLWAELLGIERVGIHNNFFALGGHSLLATRLVSRLRRELSCELPIRALFEAPTIAQLAERLPAASAEAAPIPVVSRDRPLPLSFAQQRLWFLQQLEPESSAYNVPLAVRLVGSLDLKALRAALSALLARHEVLRTNYREEQGEALQVIAAQGEADWNLVDLGHLSGDAQAEAARRIAAEQRETPFDLTRDPVLRVAVVRLGATEHLLLATVHHIAADGWGLAVMIRELAALYAAFHDGQPDPLPPLPIQYADYAVWQRQWLSGAELERQLAYWTQQLGDQLPVLELPADRPRPPVASGQGGHCRWSLPPALLQALQQQAQGQGTSLFMLLLAAFDVWLYAHTGRLDPVIGTDIANRHRAETEGLLGFFVNQLALKADLRGNPTFRELLQRTRAQVLEAYAHQDLPFDRLVEALNPPRSLAYTPLFQVKLVLQNQAEERLLLPSLEVRPEPIAHDQAEFDLLLVISESAGGLDGLLRYRSDLFDADSARAFAEQYLQLLERCAAAPEERIELLAREVAESARTARLARQQAQAAQSLGRLQGARRKSLVSLQKNPVETSP